MRRALALLAMVTTLAQSAPPPLSVHEGGHYFQAAGQPVTWVGDTAWMLIHGTTRAETSYYLATRARQGFNLVQTVVLAEFDGQRKPSAIGLLPFKDLDPDQPIEAYFDRVVEVVDEAAARGLYVALVPAWGDKLEGSWGSGPALFTLADLPKAQRFAEYLARKLQGRRHVVWMLGGDRPAFIDAKSPEWLRGYLQREAKRDAMDWRPIWRAMAAGIRKVAGPEALIAFHPAGGLDGTSRDLHREPWLAMHGMQSGHGGGHDVPVWEAVQRDFALPQPKPTLDLEPNYEDHPVNPWPRWDPALGYFRDDDVRRQTYRAVFAGAAGVTYGHHAVWQFTGERNEPINFPDRDWRDALWRPGAQQMGLLRRLMDSRASFARIPLPQALRGQAGGPPCHARATGAPGHFVMAYLPCAGQSLELNLASLAGKPLRSWWWDPRTGVALDGPAKLGAGWSRITTPAHGPDWVLVVDDASRSLPPPGL